MWQILILFYFVFGTTAYLIRRVLAQKVPEYNRLINAVFFVFFLLPAIFVLLPFFPHNLNVGMLNFFLLLLGGSLFPIVGIIAFYANKKVEVGIFTIFNNLSPIFTLLIAIPFLNESFSGMQYIGAGLLIVSGVLAAWSQMRGEGRISASGIFACLMSAVVLGIAVAYERFMLTRVDFGAYLVYGWGAQILWSVLLAHKLLRSLPKLFAKTLGVRRLVLAWGGASVLKSTCFIIALKMSTASVVSSVTNFLSVVVVICAYFFLKEKNHMVHKIVAVALGVIGLLLIAK